MEDRPEARKPDASPVLRDRLAENRTALANERTFLAYVRTALTLFAAGVTFVRFFGSSVIEAIGWVFIPLGFYTMAKGIASYRRMKRVMREEELLSSEREGKLP